MTGSITVLEALLTCEVAKPFFEAVLSTFAFLVHIHIVL